MSADEAVEGALKELQLSVGDIYEDCDYHPCLCVSISTEDDDISGISLIDGTQPRSCSLIHCGIRKLSVAEAWNIKLNGPTEKEVAENYTPDKRWWK